VKPRRGGPLVGAAGGSSLRTRGSSQSARAASGDGRQCSHRRRTTPCTAPQNRRKKEPEMNTTIFQRLASMAVAAVMTVAMLAAVDALATSDAPQADLLARASAARSA
jgi:hypothetical protein